MKKAQEHYQLEVLKAVIPGELERATMNREYSYRHMATVRLTEEQAVRVLATAIEVKEQEESC